MSIYKIVITSLLTLSASSVLAATLTPVGKIVSYHTGYDADIIRVTLQGATYQEEPACPIKDGYITAKDANDQQGYTTHAAALLAAFASGKNVQLVIQGCEIGRPRIIGVNLYQ